MKERHYSIAFHISFWALNYIYSIVFWGYFVTTSRAFLIVPFYINYFILVPYFFRKGNILSLAIWFALIWSSMTAIHAGFYYGYCYFHHCIEKMERTRDAFIGGYVSFYFIAVSTGSRLIVDWVRNKKITQELLLKKTNTQIQSIRTNVNLPFVLETLESIEAEAKKSPESIQRSVIALSNLMRHGLYHSGEPYTSLQKETDIINDYLLLINQNQNAYSLTFETIGDFEKAIVPPTIMVKFISIWKDFYHHDLKGNLTIAVMQREGLLTLRIPHFGYPNSFLDEVDEKLIFVHQGSSVLKCSIENNIIVLNIINSVNEN